MANSNRHIDLTLRQKYRDENIGCCEIALELGIDFSALSGPQFFHRAVLRIPAHDNHHIWGGNPRHDLWSNFCCLHRHPHRLVHDGYKGEARYIRLLAMLSKAVKANRIDDPREFDVAELDKAAGKSVRGWIEYFAVDPSWDWITPYRDELLERMQ